MPDRTTAEEKLTALRGLVLKARSMPMSASCVINRNEVLTAIDDVIAGLPDEIAAAQDVIEQAKDQVSASRDEAAQIVAEAREHAAELAKHSEVVRVAERQAEQIKADAEAEAAALRRETDSFVDSRMASFESVLHKTSSQVRTARARLAERSNLNGSHLGEETTMLPAVRTNGSAASASSASSATSAASSASSRSALSAE